jgi:hypothetical protein
MKIFKGYIILSVISTISLFLLSYQAYPSQPQMISIKAISRVDKRSIGIGDKIHYATTVYVGSDVEVEFPQTTDTIANFDVKGSGTEQKYLFGKKVLTKWLTLTSYVTGEQTIPGVAVKYRGQGQEYSQIISNSITINVESIFKKAKIESDIKDIEPPMSFAWVYKAHFFVGVFILAFMVYIIILLVRKRQEELERIRKGPPEELLAYNKLNSMLASSDNRDLVAEDLINIAQLTKEYLISRYKFKKRQMTTEEFLTAIKEQKDLFGKYGESLSRFLRASDIIKFASQSPNATEHNQFLKGMKDLLNDIKPEEETI